jgi:HTH-type transcriptional regulator/antitoxin HigA
MDAVIEPAVVDEIKSRYEALNALVPLHPISTEGGLEKAISVMNQLLDAGAADENHPLAGLVETLGTLIGAYEDTHNRMRKVTPAAVLRMLMDQHELSQSALPEVGTQGVISEILSGKRELNLRQIRALSAKFNVPASVFI